MNNYKFIKVTGKCGASALRIDQIESFHTMVLKDDVDPELITEFDRAARTRIITEDGYIIVTETVEEILEMIENA